MKKIALGFLAVSALSCTTSQQAQKDDAYTQLSKKIIEASQQEKPDAQAIAKDAAQLTTMGKEIAQKYAAKHAECAEYLKVVIDSADNLKNIQLSEIEEKFHDGGALPKAPVKCQNPKDLIVHPATVSILTKDLSAEAQKQVKDELDEVLEHYDAVVEEL